MSIIGACGYDSQLLPSFPLVQLTKALKMTPSNSTTAHVFSFSVCACVFVCGTCMCVGHVPLHIVAEGPEADMACPALLLSSLYP